MRRAVAAALVAAVLSGCGGDSTSTPAGPDTSTGADTVSASASDLGATTTTGRTADPPSTTSPPSVISSSSAPFTIPLITTSPALPAPGTLAAGLARDWALVMPATLGGDLPLADAPRIDQQLVWRVENGTVVFRLLGFVPRPPVDVGREIRDAALASGWTERAWTPDDAVARAKGSYVRDGVSLALVVFPAGASTAQIQLFAETDDIRRGPTASDVVLPDGLGLPEGAAVTGVDLRPAQGRPTSTLTFTAPLDRETVLAGYATALRTAGWQVTDGTSITAVRNGIEVRILAGPQTGGSAVTLAVVGPPT